MKNSHALLKRILVLLPFAVIATGCEVSSIPVSQYGVLAAEGKLNQVIYEEDGYQLCFDLTLDKKVLSPGNIDGSEGISTKGLMYNDAIDTCRPFYTNQDGSYEIYFKYHLASRTKSGTPAVIKIKQIDAYILSTKGVLKKADPRRIDAVITNYSNQNDLYRLTLNFMLNTNAKNASKNNVNISINQK